MASSDTGLSSQYIDIFLKNHNLPLYKGIFPIDKCPAFKKIKGDFCIILNTDKASKPGQHWFVIMREHNNIIVSDSLKLLNINETKKILKNAIFLREYPIQPLTTNMCGFYCIHDIILFHLKKCKIKPNTKKFVKKPSLLNDTICISNIEKMLPVINAVL